MSPKFRALAAFRASAFWLSGCAGWRQTPPTPRDPRLEDVVEIKKAGEREAALTRQLLAFGRGSGKRIRPTGRGR